MNANPPSDLRAGASVGDLTPAGSVFLYGYPHVPRMSTGVHDPLLGSALYLDNGYARALVLAVDLIWVGRAQVEEVRRRVAARTGVAVGEIAIGATHTHSGPVTSDYLSNAADPVVPRADPAYVASMVDRLVETACEAVAAAEPAETGLAVADATGVGTNRHDPAGPADPAVPVLLVRRRGGDRAPIACLLVHAMHPTVLHEDSMLVSGDYPAFCRQHLWTSGALPRACAVLHLSGASGDQSPRHVTRANTFAEAKRLGEMLAGRIARVLPGIRTEASPVMEMRRDFVSLEPRELPAVAAAESRATKLRARLERLRRQGAPRPAVRSAECDVFGAEETIELARAVADGRHAAAVAACTPAEIQVLRLARWSFVFWPGEFFVAYALRMRQRMPGTYVVTLANGELQGYVVTREAEQQGCYEAGNALFSAASGERFLEASLRLLQASSPRP